MSNNIRTVEKITHVDNPQNRYHGIDPDGYATNMTADTIGTRVVLDTVWEEYQVWMYIDGTRFPDGDYFASDKEDALGTAHGIRNGWNSIQPTYLGNKKI